jgi:hypothetical protein
MSSPKSLREHTSPLVELVHLELGYWEPVKEGRNVEEAKPAGFASHEFGALPKCQVSAWHCQLCLCQLVHACSGNALATAQRPTEPSRLSASTHHVTAGPPYSLLVLHSLLVLQPPINFQ